MLRFSTPLTWDSGLTAPYESMRLVQEKPSWPPVRPIFQLQQHITGYNIDGAVMHLTTKHQAVELEFDSLIQNQRSLQNKFWTTTSRLYLESALSYLYSTLVQNVMSCSRCGISVCLFRSLQTIVRLLLQRHQGIADQVAQLPCYTHTFVPKLVAALACAMISSF